MGRLHDRMAEDLTLRNFSPATLGAGLLSGYSVNKPGMDVGVGIAFGTKWNGVVRSTPS